MGHLLSVGVEVGQIVFRGGKEYRSTEDKVG